MGRKKDHEKRKIAFKLYRRDTKLTDIADELGVTAPLISQWKRDDEWDVKMEKTQGLLKARMEIKEQIETTELLADDEIFLHTLRDLEGIVLEKVYNEEIEPVSWSDVVNTIKFANEQRRLMLGKPTSKVETTISVEVQGLTNDELDQRLEETKRAVTLLELGKDKEAS